MGTHPIFESDFDCLTDFEQKCLLQTLQQTKQSMRSTVLLTTASKTMKNSILSDGKGSLRKYTNTRFCYAQRMRFIAYSIRRNASIRNASKICIPGHVRLELLDSFESESAPANIL